MYGDLLNTIGFVETADPEVGEAMELELKRQRRNLELIASENIVSPAVMAAMGTVLTNKYAEGYPGHRYYGGCADVDIVENIARERACRLFGAEHANVQPHSGAQANLAVYFALLQPGDTVLGMNLAEGGHLTHGSPVNMSGAYYNFAAYGVDPVTHTSSTISSWSRRANLNRSSSSPAQVHTRAQSILRNSARLPMHARTSWSIWRTLRVLLRAAAT